MRTSLQRSSAAAFLVALVALLLPEAATARTQEPGTAVVHHAAEARSAQSGTDIPGIPPKETTRFTHRIKFQYFP